MSCSPSGVRAATTLALWAASWQVGSSADHVLAALDGTGFRAGVRAGSACAAEASGLPGPGEPSAGTVDLLGLLRRGGRPALLLPVSGDLRGMPAGGDVVIPALDAGAAVVLPDAGVALVPTDGHWRAFRSGPPHPTLGMGEVTQLVDGAVTDATRTLATADISSSQGNPREAVRRAILAEAVDTPPGMPPAAASLLAKSITLAALLAVAAGHTTAAVTSREMAVVDDALHPLGSAVREARRTAVAATVSELLSASGRSAPFSAIGSRDRHR
jgi:hypothetical protein